MQHNQGHEAAAAAMSDHGERMITLLHLARAAQSRNQPYQRDKLLALAGASAAALGLDSIAAACRTEILADNPGHLIRQFPSFLAAQGDEDFEAYLAQLRRQFPSEKIEFMLRSLGIDPRRELGAQGNHEQNAAALLQSASPDDSETSAPLSQARADGVPGGARLGFWLGVLVLLGLLAAVVAGLVWRLWRL
jgi:hypothetical protein